MGLGYEGWVRIDNEYALGTGASAPRARSRLESASGYGGNIDSSEETMGLGLPYNYDWDQYDGSLNFEVSADFYENIIFDWLFDRQSIKEVKLSSRNGNLQEFTQSFWTSISLSASEGAAVDGSLGFYAIGRDTYTYGNSYISDPEAVKRGATASGTNSTVACVSGGIPTDSPINPVPYWNTRIEVSGTPYEFIDWSVNFTQDIGRFYVCEANTSSQEPKYLAAGPMGVTFSGSYMQSSGFLGDTLDFLEVYIGAKKLTLRRLEASTESDDVQSPDALVPLTVDYGVYEISSL